MEANYPLCHKEPARSKQRPDIIIKSSLDIPRPMRLENSARVTCQIVEGLFVMERELADHLLALEIVGTALQTPGGLW